MRIGAKLRRSHFLFLGYPLGDWHVRVFLHRLWGREKPAYRSWAVEAEPDPVELVKGEKGQVTATGYFSAGSILDITWQVKWSVKPRSVASIGNSTTKGLITAKKIGSTTIKATRGNKTGTAELIVSAP